MSPFSKLSQASRRFVHLFLILGCTLASLGNGIDPVAAASAPVPQPAILTRPVAHPALPDPPILPRPTVQAQTPTIRLDAIVQSYWDTPDPANSNCGPGGQPLGQYTVALDGGAGALMSWINAPAGSYIAECWTTEFHQVGLVAGNLVKVCTTGDFPYHEWFDSATRWPAQFNWRTDTVWLTENGPVSDEYGGRCMAGHFGGGTTLT